MADIAIITNQALLDAAEWAEVSVWVIIAAIAVGILIVLMLVFYCIRRKQRSLIKIYATKGEAGDDALEFVETTLVEFPADQIKIEATKGNVIIKLVSVKPVTDHLPETEEKAEESLLPQEVKGEPLPTKVEESKPPTSKKPEPEKPASEEKQAESDPIPMGAVEPTPEEKEPK